LLHLVGINSFERKSITWLEGSQASLALTYYRINMSMQRWNSESSGVK